MGIKTNMSAFVRKRLPWLNANDVYFLTEHILSIIGYTHHKNFMGISERNQFENLFKEKFSEIFDEYKEITPYEFYLIKKKIECQSGILYV
ncbi:hypothetical protein NYR61_04515 [Actinobacillus genomosp. 1]|uniref:hypothetical protein n=1 Tax=Actinobacillus genomosp. 1 TaxID=254839 RepID=UPI002441CC51|nr:hypothetical protein [Actinobacillus genomosp. 1]WGE34814.1 hypothetical protein NYR61_04515 [Actinobacillus genomosp. 1]